MAVETDISFEQAQENLLEVTTEVADHATEIAELLSSPGLAGDLGFTEPLTGDRSEAEVKQELTDSVNEFESAIESAEDFPDLVLSWSELMDSYYGIDVPLDDEQKGSPVPNSLIANLGRARGFLEQLGDAGGRDFYGTSVDFAQQLEQQRMLQESTMVIIAYFTHRMEDGMVYVNTFLTQVAETINELLKIAESDEVDVAQLVEMYRRCGTYYEHALPPILALISYLEDEEVDLDTISSMTLANSLSRVQSFGPLAEFVEPFDSDIRNALSHGGRSGHSSNHVKESVTFRYEAGDSVQTKEMSFTEFKEQTVEASAGAISLFLLPFFTILLYSYVEIQRKFEDQRTVSQAE